MLNIFLQIFPFFAIIGLGFFAARGKLLGEKATDYLTQFVFYFALPAMLFRLAAGLDLSEIFNGRFVLAYWLSGFSLYILVTLIAYWRKVDSTTAAIEAQCAVFGNSGFMAIPMVLGIFGESASGWLLLILAVDIIFFGNLVIVMIALTRQGRFTPEIFKIVAVSLLKNPMVMSMAIGLIYSLLQIPNFAPIDRTVEILGAAATPCALFAIGASLASRTAERLSVALWLSAIKLIAHPAMAAIFALLIFPVDPFAAKVMIIVAAMPAAGNIYIVARHYNVAPMRVSAAILVSTTLSIITLSVVLALIGN